MIILEPQLKNYIEIFNNLKCRYNIVAVSGYFDPPTPAHLKYFRAARNLGDILIVILNTDKQLLTKRLGTSLEGRIRYPFNDRAELINELKSVDYVVPSIDTDNSVAETLALIKPHIFAKGGDRQHNNLPYTEINVTEELGIKIVSGVGGEKTHSSSWYDW